MEGQVWDQRGEIVSGSYKGLGAASPGFPEALGYKASHPANWSVRLGGVRIDHEDEERGCCDLGTRHPHPLMVPVVRSLRLTNVPKI